MQTQAHPTTKLEWSVTSEDGRVLDLSVAGVLATSAHGLNLVVHPNQLLAGFSYTFRLSGARTDQSAQIGYSEQALFIKSPPEGGVIKTEPRTGTPACLCRVACVICHHVSCAVCHASCIMCHVSCVVWHMPCVVCRVSL